MLLPSRKETIHRAWLYRLLTAICDSSHLAGVLYFKGGTCAAMHGFLDRFSVALDFDYVGENVDIPKTRAALESIFNDLGLIIADSSSKVPQYFLKYPNKPNERNALKLDVATFRVKANKYEPVRLVDIDRIVYCQTKETMFANKLVATMERFDNNGTLAGRDIYDIHYFFMQGFAYDADVIAERRKTDSQTYIRKLTLFLEKHLTQTIIDQDINTLLPPEKFRRIRKLLKQEVLMFLKNEGVRP